MSFAKAFKDKSEWPSEDYAWSSRENDYLDDSELIWNTDGSGKIVSVTKNRDGFTFVTGDSDVTFKSDAFQEEEVSEERAAGSKYTSRTEPRDIQHLVRRIPRDIQHLVRQIPRNIQHLLRRIPRDIQNLVRRIPNSSSKNSGAGKSSRYTRRD